MKLLANENFPMASKKHLADNGFHAVARFYRVPTIGRPLAVFFQYFDNSDKKITVQKLLVAVGR